MAACGETPKFTEQQELKEDIGWHAICTTTGGRHRKPETRNLGSREGVVPMVVEEE